MRWRDALRSVALRLSQLAFFFFLLVGQINLKDAEWKLVKLVSCQPLLLTLVLVLEKKPPLTATTVS